jgi:hypothetical protein
MPPASSLSREGNLLKKCVLVSSLIRLVNISLPAVAVSRCLDHV